MGKQLNRKQKQKNLQTTLFICKVERTKFNAVSTNKTIENCLRCKA